MLFIAYPAFGFALIAASVWLAAITGDPSWVPRGGTLLTAFSAVFLIYEAFFERAISRRTGDAKPEPDPSLSRVSPVARIADRIERLRWQAKRQESEDQKLRLVILNSFMIIIGELIQGFGDLAYVLMLGS